MNMKKKAETIYHRKISKNEKLRLLNELVLDCNLELEAASENMHPEAKDNLAEGLRVATDYIRRIEESLA